MARMIGILLPPLAALLGLFVFVDDPATARPDGPPEPVVATTGSEVVPPPPLGRASARPAAAGGAGTTEPAPPPRQTPENRARLLIDDLEDWVGSGIEGAPEAILRDLTSLMEEFPECADLLLSLLEGRDRRVWQSAGGAFARLSDFELQVRLVRAHRAMDPWNARLGTAWTSVDALLEVLRHEEDPAFRIRVIDGIPDELMQDELVVSRLRGIADSDLVERTRARAIRRLARSGTPEVDEYLMNIVEDPGRPDPDRRAAAMSLVRRPDREVRDLFLRVLEKRDSTPVLFHAVRGLAVHMGDPGVTDRLLLELEYAGNPERVRGAAAAVLSRGMGSLSVTARDAVLERVRGLASDLGNTGDTPGLLDDLESSFGRHWEGTTTSAGAEAVLMTR